MLNTQDLWYDLHQNGDKLGREHCMYVTEHALIYVVPKDRVIESEGISEDEWNQFAKDYARWPSLKVWL